MEPTFGHESREAGPNPAHHRGAVLILDHLLARALDHKDDLFSAGVVVAGVSASRGHIDQPAGKARGAVDLGADGQGQTAPVEAEGGHGFRAEEEVGHGRGSVRGQG
jgi:hypothetical protein